LSDFITDGSAVLPAVKTDARSPSGAATEIKAADLNQTRQALLDLRDQAISSAQDISSLSLGTPSASSALVTATGGSNARSLADRAADVIRVMDYSGADPTGVTDSTTAIQNALNAGGKTVVLGKGTFLVSYVGTKTINGTANRYALSIPTGVTFDLQGGTLRLANSSNAAILINGSASAEPGYTDADISVVNGTLDGNKSNQTNPATGEMPCLSLQGVLRPIVRNLTVNNARDYAGRFLNIDYGTFDGLTCTGSDGDCWSFGTSGSKLFEVRYSQIDNVKGVAGLGTYGTLQGNPAIFTVQYSQVGKVIGQNCAGGIKIQNTSKDSNFAELTFIGPTNGTANSGVKVQGDNGGALYPDGISIGSITCRDSVGAGLYLAYFKSLRIGSYRSYNCGAAGSTADVFVPGPNSIQRLHIDRIFSESPKFYGMSIGGAVDYYTIGSIHVHNTPSRAVQIGAASYGVIGEIIASDDQGSPTLTQALNVTDSGAKGKALVVKTNLAHSTSQLRLGFPAAGYDYEVVSYQGGSTALEGVVTLSNGATSTSVSCDSVWRNYVGGTADYVHPIIQVQPFNSSAMALGAMRVTVTDGSSGTGFSIKHASAGASDKVYWKILGWRVVAAPGA
jgi:hypothetical protein